jgi:formylglycine-generating enzyme required for sulfatase activity
MLGQTVVMRLLRVLPGTYLRGFGPEERNVRSGARAQDPVEIKTPFYLGVYEVTHQQYAAHPAMYDGKKDFSPSYWRRVASPSWPIDGITWNFVKGKNGFLEQLNNALSGNLGNLFVADLPSEDEWEYACRAGTQSSFNNGRNLENIKSDPGLDVLAQYNRGDSGTPSPVGAFEPNAWGFYDMHGNVAEWCSNNYLRGGSWKSSAADCRSAERTLGSKESSNRDNRFGFRLALHLKEKEKAPAAK